MAKKRRFKLKKKFRRSIFLLLVLIGLSFGGFKIYQKNAYYKTIEGRLVKKGYAYEVARDIEDKMTKEDVEYLLGEDKIDYVKDLINDKYFIKENFKTYMDYYEENSKKDFDEVIKIVNTGANKAWYSEVKTADVSDRYLVLVNKFNSLPENYDAGVIKKFSSTYAFGEVSAEEECYNAFIRMATAAKEDGITLVATSGYRTYAHQKQLFDDMARQKGDQYALEYAAKPGTSEHETGLALDIFTYGGVMETFKTTKTYEWLHTHAHEYGFIERYLEGTEYLTGYAPEAWHYRYVGVDMAKRVVEEGITYDEYYAFYLERR